MKEAKDARYTNGHLFTTISVSGMTMCYACNKSITAKEALICPSKLDPECHSDSHLPICPFCSGSIGVTLHAEPQLGPNARPRCLLPCSLSSHRGVVAGGLWHKQDSLGGWGRGDEDGSQCSCHPLGVPGSLNSWGADWGKSRNACVRAGGGRRGELGVKLLNLQLALPIFWAELDVQDSRGPWPLPVFPLWVRSEMSAA